MTFCRRDFFLHAKKVKNDEGIWIGALEDIMSENLHIVETRMRQMIGEEQYKSESLLLGSKIGTSPFPPFLPYIAVILN